MKDTQVWKLEGGAAAERELAAAAGLLRAGGLVAFPTETVYGLGADAGNTAAVEGIFAAKGRPSDNPLIVHIAGREQLNGLALPWSGTAEALMARFWPGPLTLVLPAVPGAVSPRVTAGLDTVAVRMPAHDVALRLIAAAGCPVAAPSANRSGRPSPTRAEHVREDLAGRIDGLVDGGPTGVGLESTVVEVDGGVIRILRPGSITAEMLREAAPDAEVEGGADHPAGEAVDPAAAAVRAGTGPVPAAEAPRGRAAADAGTAAPRSPGMKYTHYAPRGVMTLVAGEPREVAAYIRAEAGAAAGRGERTGVLARAGERPAAYEADAVVAYASPDEAARGLYDALRAFDTAGVQRIWAEAWPETGIGQALMNRLVKAAGGRVVRL